LQAIDGGTNSGKRFRAQAEAQGSGLGAVGAILSFPVRRIETGRLSIEAALVRAAAFVGDRRPD
jgi:hypothetical protein